MNTRQPHSMQIQQDKRGAHTEDYPLRRAAQVMQLDRLGSFHQSRLSFMRTLVRRIMREQWRIECSLFQLDDNGYGTAIYTVHARHHTFSFILFSSYLADEDRNDRVIADKWDLTMALSIGPVTEEQLEVMRANVPLQEAGRVTADTLVLSRANRSSRNFEYVVNELAAGRQPASSVLADVGYLYRTTAVYGSGKFGMADWSKIRQGYPDFASPFAAEMFTCYMLRHFSVEQAEYLASMRCPKTAVAMEKRLRRYIGIGNATGLGMAPYLIKHPQLISRWILMRETAVARVVHAGEVTTVFRERLQGIVAKARQHFRETRVSDDFQKQRNSILLTQLGELQDWLEQDRPLYSWRELISYAEENWHLETQELIHSLLMELYPERVDALEEDMGVEETSQAQPQMSLRQFKALIEEHYDWALRIDFEQTQTQQLFWYRSQEKMEPRIGDRFTEPGADREIPLLTIARSVCQCYQRVCLAVEKSTAKDLVHFLLQEPDMKGISTRIQTMARDPYGDIQANLADNSTLPIHLLRCKLSFFGVSKFDPKSRFWVRNTMFQGAPLLSDIGKPFHDDWYFPLAPQAH
jgi:hypothetical protein